MKKTPLKKTAQSRTVGWWANKAWEIFSLFIRTRDRGYCITCGTGGHKGSDYHAGHCIPDSVGGILLRFHPKNVNGQCSYCNLELGGNREVYERRIDMKWGLGTMDELKRFKRVIGRADVGAYKIIIRDYKAKLETLIKI